MNPDTLPSLVGRLLKRNKIPFDKAELSFQIQSHPSYPSLHAITGVLDHFKIENVAARVPVEKASLAMLPNTFIAQFDHELVVATRKNKGIEIHDNSPKPHLLATVDFLEKFTGVVVAAEASEVLVENSKTDYTINALAGVLGFLLVMSLYLSGPAVASIAFLLTGVIGFGISVAIVKQEYGISNALGNALCTATSEKKDCDAVLNSKGATLLGRYKFSDLSMVYFFALTLFSFFTLIYEGQLTVGYYLSILTVPITLYSIYYQGLVVKKWCLLCLSIVGLLWVQTALALFVTNLSVPIDLNSALLLVVLGLATFTGWTLAKPQYEAFRSNQQSRIDFTKFKRNFDLFSTLLNQSEVIDTASTSDLEIVFGNLNAPTEITIVTNPFCGHCRPVHALIEDVLSKYADMSKITIRFNISLEDEETEVVRIATRLLEIYEQQSKDICLMAMGEIYTGMLVKEWLAKWSACSNPQKYLEALKMGKDWCIDHRLNFTPVILINGRTFPASYERTDLIYFIEELYEAGLSAMESETPEEVMV